jgi:hypothetical protein
MSAEMLVYNAEEHVFGYLRADFAWQPDGSIAGSSQVLGLPGIWYAGDGTSPWQDYVKTVSDV